MIEKLRPGVINSKYWNPERPPKKEWNKIRKTGNSLSKPSSVFL